MAYQSSYQYNCIVKFNYKGKDYDILSESVKYILINHDYRNRVMPLVYLKISLSAKLYNTMVPAQGIGKIYFNLMRKKKGGTSSIYKSCIMDEFEYYMTDDPNSFKKLDDISDQSYKNCIIGLIKSSLTEQNQRTFSGIYKNTNTVSLIQSATQHMKMIMQPFINNINLDSFSCPPIGSVGQFIAYVNSQYSFYNGSYIYFMDFDRTYLRSNDGSYIDAKDGGYPYIAFDIRDMTQYQAQTVGIVEDSKQKAYIIYVDGADAKIEMDRVTPELNGNITTITAEGDAIAKQIDTSAITNITSNMSGSTVLRSDDPNAARVAASTLEESSGTLIITKTDMDSRIFTPNRQFLLSNYESNPKYCGIYYMISKQEIYLRQGPAMNCQITIAMKKAADFAKKK